MAHKKPNIFSAKKKQGKSNYDIFDIVRAKNQFHGFEDYPALHPSLKTNINMVLMVANNYKDSRRERYAEFVNNILLAASKDAMNGFSDPCPTGLYGWRTKGSEHPRGMFEVFKDFAGQTFYTIKE